MAKRRRKLSQPDIDMDLTPMIDIIFLLILFFILAGRITAEISTQEITVPPTKSAEDIRNTEWDIVKVEVWGDTQDKGGEAGHKIKIGFHPVFISRGSRGQEAFVAYQQLRKVLDDLYDRSPKIPDPAGTGMQLPKVILELRADADTEYRVVQEILQVATDSVDPFPDAQGNFMMPKKHASPAAARPFVHFHYTTRLPGE